MAFLRIDIDVADLDCDAIEARCFELGALSITLVDQRDDAILEPLPGEIRLWPATRLQALFDPATFGASDSPDLLDRLAAALEVEVQRLVAQDVADRAWEREWLKDFKPLRFGRRLWVIPNAFAAPPDAECILRLDPGLAFGTGTHVTTAMCLTWLDSQLAPQSTVIDYGCGSGILALAALRLGSAQAHAFDIDPQALLATADNAAANALGTHLQCVADAALLPRADVVLANILAGPLIELAPRLAALIKPCGHLVLAGLLDTQSAGVIAAYRPYLELKTWKSQEGWTLLAGQRRDDAAQCAV
jgi:ribosomal protein L11 methyltransferase